MTNYNSTIRLRAGASAVLVFVGTVIVLGVILSSGLELPGQAIERGAVDDFLQNMTSNTTALAIVVWTEVLFNILIVVFGIDLYRILANGRSGLVFAPVALIGGSVLFVIELLLLLGISHGLAPVYVGAAGAEQSTIAGTTLALLVFRNRLLVVAGVLWSLAVISFGREMLHSSEFPGWMGYVGYAAGGVGIIGGFFPLFTSLFVVRALGGLLIVIWVLIAGIVLFRNR